MKNFKTVGIDEILQNKFKPLDKFSETSLENLHFFFSMPVVKNSLKDGGCIAGGVARNFVLAGLGKKDFPSYRLKDQKYLPKQKVYNNIKNTNQTILNIHSNRKQVSEDLKKIYEIVKEEEEKDSALAMRERDLINSSLTFFEKATGRQKDFEGCMGQCLHFERQINTLSRIYGEDIDVFFHSKNKFLKESYLFPSEKTQNLFNSEISFNSAFGSRQKYSFSDLLEDAKMLKVVSGSQFMFPGLAKSLDSFLDNSVKNHGYEPTEKTPQSNFDLSMLVSNYSFLQQPISVQFIEYKNKNTHEEIIDSFDSLSVSFGIFLSDWSYKLIYTDKGIRECQNDVVVFNKTNKKSISGSVRRYKKYFEKSKIDVSLILENLREDILFSQIQFLINELKRLDGRRTLNNILKNEVIKTNIEIRETYLNFLEMEVYFQENLEFKDLFSSILADYEKAKKANFLISQFLEHFDERLSHLRFLGVDKESYFLLEGGFKYAFEKLKNILQSSTVEEFYERTFSLEKLYPDSEYCDLFYRDEKLLSAISSKI